MKIQITQIPDEVIAEYNFENKVHSDGAVFIEIQKGMYGLPQASMLANKRLKRRLAKNRYYEVRHTPIYWEHMVRPINFTLVIDDVGVVYENNEHALHLLQTLCQYYEAVSVDWTGTLYCGITLKCDYCKRTCKLSLPRYVQQAINKFQYGIKSPSKAMDAPHPYKATKKTGITHDTTNGQRRQTLTTSDKTYPTDHWYRSVLFTSS